MSGGGVAWDDPLHPFGACTCAGEGVCAWCHEAEAREEEIEAPPYAEESPRQPGLTRVESRHAPNDTIVVSGGAKSPPELLEPARDLTSGEADPEVLRMVREGASRYHLDTLREAAQEAAACEALGAVTIVDEEGKPAAARALNYAAERQRVHEETRAALLKNTAEVIPLRSKGSGAALEKLDAIEQARMEALGRDMARAMLGEADAAEEADALARFDRAMEKPCGGAACRSLKDCLCACKRCRVACASRKGRR